jgi:hypothetical protein
LASSPACVRHEISVAVTLYAEIGVIRATPIRTSPHLRDPPNMNASAAACRRLVASRHAA